ncbi:MAG: hypothetical protein IKX30_03555 [Victivallales bacterium]|nr:hypothetical protein [Victivallales bacterium]
MGAKDNALKRYLSDKKVIADIFNMAFGADGLSVDPEKLKDLDSVQVMAVQQKTDAKDAKKQTSYRERIHDGVTTLETEFGGTPVRLVLNVEGQTAVSQAMPLRILQYEDQSLTFIAERMAEGVKSKDASGDWLSGWPEGAVLPNALSVTLYTGADDWTGPRSLREIQANIPKALAQRMMDMPLNVLTFKDICKHDPDSLLSDIGVVAAYIVYEKDSDKLQELIKTKEKFRHLSRKGFDVINTHRKLAITIPEDKEEIDMHYAEQVWANKAKAEGILIGEERGKADERKNNIGIFIDGCRSFGIKPEAIASKLVELYKLSYNDAMSLIKSRPDGNVSHPALS